MIRGGKDVLIIALAATCLIVSLLLQPWAELGFKGDFPAWISWLTGWIGLDKLFNALGDTGLAKSIQEYLSQQGARTNLGDYAYSLFLFVALIVASIAIILIGREESEEKLLLPVKK